MANPRPPLLSDRYVEWREHSPVQRHFLRICALSLVVLGLMLASDDLALWIARPFVGALHWLLGPTPSPAPDVRGPEFTLSSGDGPDPFYFVGGTVFTGVCVLIVAATLYGIALLVVRRAMRRLARTHESSSASSAADSSDAQPN